MRQRGYGGGSSGGTTSIVSGTTPIAGGTAGRILYDNGTVVSESPNLTFDGTNLTVGGNVTIPQGSSILLGSNLFATNVGGTVIQFGSGGSNINFSFASATVGVAMLFTATTGTFLYTPIASAPAVVFQGAALRTQALTQFLTSAGGSLGNVSGGCIADVFADVSTTHTDGTFDTLKSVTLVANALIANGDKIFFDYTLKTVSNATAARDFKLTFAGITIYDSTGLVFGANAGTIRITGYIIRASATTCRATVRFEPSGSATIVAFQSTTYTPESTLTGLTLTGTNNLVLSGAASGTGAASSDITLVQGNVSIGGFGS